MQLENFILNFFYMANSSDLLLKNKIHAKIFNHATNVGEELDTPIWTRNGQNHEENTIKLVPWALNDGEDKIVGENIASILK